MNDHKIENYSTATQWGEPHEMTEDEKQKMREVMAKCSQALREKQELLERIALRYPVLSSLLSNPQFVERLDEAIRKEKEKPE
jgi:hypothetical protein